jgi:hypothetical protein
MKHSVRSSLPRSRRSSASARRIFASTPVRDHCWNRRWHVAGEGYRFGTSCHGAPVRSTHSTPLFAIAAAAKAGQTAIVLEIPKPDAIVQQFGKEIDLATVMCRELARMTLELDDCGLLPT